ncbi:hypothetical protein L2E82_28717 [Cichorium intybus]|uniref:Uncharacterized protein n=1 Tax=Cichorium intybus TaxID=13427 RepID=A0ACB9CWF2_CICIN|nr:hypothetical protein L2E82_28717 [Cichorium intybus]
MYKLESTTSFEEYITCGPWGGWQGKDWIYIPEGFIKTITIAHGIVIDSIKFEVESSSDEIQRSFFGGNGGRADTIFIDSPNEYLTSISGTVGSFAGSDVVMSLRFQTNQKRYGPFGSDKGTHFSFDGKGGVIIGFHGRFGSFIDAIGIYLMPKSLAFDRDSTREESITNELFDKMSLMAMPREAGPWGACGAKPWDDGVFLNVKQVRVHVGESPKVIYGIQFEYVRRDGQSVLSQIHGGTNGEKIEVVDLDGADEYLTGISGFYGPVEGHNGLEAIMAITFHTNKKIYGPFGYENGSGFVYFSSTASPGKIVGFQGRNNGFLSAIGVHMEYF